jgi:dTDP-4-amino-4,6-dideoxygalactose transaminase
MEIPQMDLARQHKSLEKELKAAFAEVLESNHYILGEKVVAFEKALAKLVGTDFAVGVGSCTDALRLALAALRIGAGDEVITTPFSFVATADVIVRAGAKPVFVDINPETFNISSEQVKAAITPRTRAVIAVHLYGLPCRINVLQPMLHARKVALIEDCAQALGAEADGKPVGGWGTIGCHSFFPTKTLGGFGDGGACTLNDAELSRELASLRAHGMRIRYISEQIGFKSRLDALQAALLLVKLPFVKQWSEDRQKGAKLYNEGLQGLPIVLPNVPQGRTHVFHQYTIRTDRRDKLANYLKANGIATAVYYPVPIHLQPAFAFLGYNAGSFPEAEKASAEVLTLPLFAGIRPVEIEYICEHVREFYQGK